MNAWAPAVGRHPIIKVFRSHFPKVILITRVIGMEMFLANSESTKSSFNNFASAMDELYIQIYDVR
ncbi:AFH_G0001060.mRNA.1.CDS.1 [Saccharomyces cerevisiae]|nr:BMC_2a_G0001100.mRNA.1.CDS.1 [Saccharomyces cerevisiae]CAI4242402.1 BMB_G0001100.mRNA.1.CDS.1 [Saccharomyces cerevisiae]CAI4244954.1 BAP_1a_G0001030.mRNA.1.CDS.1 [Saccharomyces cerevisiae]CAI4245610.1 CDN_1a_G0000970.mRNA.1.CDS.1 [Saccharomyces cerevisiae]CAI4246789.1 ALH_1b_G0001030.mRNA.1.CDS.1 [Saccharomyces cerevisiae]